MLLSEIFFLAFTLGSFIALVATGIFFGYPLLKHALYHLFVCSRKSCLTCDHNVGDETRVICDHP